MVPITFLKEGSYAKLRGYSGGNTLNISLDFRTYENHGLLIYHKFKTEGYVKVSAIFFCFNTIISLLCKLGLLYWIP